MVQILVIFWSFRISWSTLTSTTKTTTTIWRIAAPTTVGSRCCNSANNYKYKLKFFHIKQKKKKIINYFSVLNKEKKQPQNQLWLKSIINFARIWCKNFQPTIDVLITIWMLIVQQFTDKTVKKKTVFKMKVLNL